MDQRLFLLSDSWKRRGAVGVARAVIVNNTKLLHKAGAGAGAGAVAPPGRVRVNTAMTRSGF